MLVNEFPPLPVGGGERQAERLAVQLVKQGLQVGVITRGSRKLVSYEDRAGFWIKRIPQRGVGKIKSLSFLFGAIAELYRIRHSYDILHAHLAFTPAVIAVIMGRLFGNPSIIKYGNSGYYGDIKTAQTSLHGRVKLALFRRWADAHIALDENIKTELLDAGFPSDRIYYIVNGIDTSVFIPTTKKNQVKESLGKEGKIVLIFVGRFAPQKSLSVLIMAFSQALKKVSNLHLLLVGEGPEQQNLEQLIDQFSIHQKVTFTGNVEDVQKYYSASDIFVLPSLSEGISNALLEAMASGLACVVTNVGGAAHLLDGGDCGILVPPKRVDILADKIIELSQNPAQLNRLGTLARQRAQSHFDITVISKQYENLYTFLYTNRTGS